MSWPKKALVEATPLPEVILESLLSLFAVGEPAWLVANPHVLVSKETDVTLIRIATALGALSADDLEATFEQIESAFARDGLPLDAEVGATIQRMVKSRREAGL